MRGVVRLLYRAIRLHPECNMGQSHQHHLVCRGCPTKTSCRSCYQLREASQVLNQSFASSISSVFNYKICSMGGAFDILNYYFFVGAIIIIPV